MVGITQAAGPLAIFGGVLWIGFYVWLIVSGVSVAGGARQAVALAGIGVLFMAAGWAGLFRRARPAAPSRATAVVAFAGMLLFSIGALITAADVWGASWLIAILGEMVTSLGLIAFGITTLADRVLPRLNALPLLMAAFYIPSWMIDPGRLPPVFPPAFTEIMAVLYGLGWVTLGLLLWLERIRPAAQSERH